MGVVKPRMVRGPHILVFLLVFLVFRDEEVHAYQVVLESPPEYVLNMITDLGSFLKQRYKIEQRDPDTSEEDSDKRGIDFGLGRGYSGSQAARHMLGLQQVNFAGGPGKRKRSRAQPIIINVPESS